MTLKQEERIILKIKKIKAELAADKKRWGGFYDDSRELRYLLPELYVKIGDYSGGLRYMNWFKKNFSDDGGFPEFLFEWAIILFKVGKVKEAEKMVFKAFCSNTYILDKFFDNPITPIDKYESSNIDIPEYAAEYFNYSFKQANLLDFAEWLQHFIESEKFLALSHRYIDIHKQLNVEHESETRINLIDEADKLVNEI